jgi:hypothetical protein
MTTAIAPHAALRPGRVSAAPGPHLSAGTDRRVHLRGHIAVGRPQQWPERQEDAQRDAGVVLWCLSVAVGDREPRERLARMCTIPVNGVLDHPWDVGSWAMDTRILRPLWWFGLLEHRDEEVEGGRLEKRHLYRKSPLFDRFLSLDVRLDAAGGVRH